MPPASIDHATEDQKAAERIGVTPAQAMAWLLRVAQQDIDSLSRGDTANLAGELMRVVTFGVPGIKLQPHAAGGWVGEGRPFTRLLQLPVAEQKTHARRLQQIIQQALDELLRDGHVTFDLESFRVVVKRRGGLYFLSGDLLHRFRYNLAHLLGLFAPNIRRCPECQRRFLADRRNQLFCSKPCLSRVTQRNYRERLKRKQQEARKRPAKRRPQQHH